MRARKAVTQHIFRHLCENLDQNLNSPRCREIKKHLEGCFDCNAYLASLKKTIALYRRYPIPALSAGAERKLGKIARPRR
jgi:hypothetical protein